MKFKKVGDFEFTKVPSDKIIKFNERMKGRMKKHKVKKNPVINVEDITTLIEEMLDKKEEEMCNFINKNLSDSERTRVGEDIIRIMPNKADIAKIQMELLSRFDHVQDIE